MYIRIMNTQWICDIGLLLACTVQNFSFTHSSLLFVIIPTFSFICTKFKKKEEQLFGEVAIYMLWLYT